MDISKRHLNLCLTMAYRNVSNNSYSNFERRFKQTTLAFVAFKKPASITCYLTVNNFPRGEHLGGGSCATYQITGVILKYSEFPHDITGRLAVSITIPCDLEKKGP